jgi:uncharacterized repeat protein (TIGR03803 family)
MFQRDAMSLARLIVIILGLSLAVSDALGSDITLVRAFPYNSGPGLDEIQCNLIAIGSTLYGTSTYGGDDPNGQYGCAFKVNTDGSNLSFVHSFGYDDPDGMSAFGGLATDGTTLYGVTFDGGTSVNYGTLYKVNTDGSGFSVLHNQSTATNDIFSSRPPVLVGSTLYGMARQGGASGISGRGAVYKINTDSTGFELLHSFSSAGGYFPTGEPVVNGSTIFGTCDSGGSSGYGTIFKMGIDGSGFTELHAFSGGSDGRKPWGRLTVDGSTIYGFTGSMNDVTDPVSIFKIDMNSGAYQHLATLPVGLSISYGGLTLIGDTLYGTTPQGGDYNRGTVFQIGVDGTGFSILDSFDGNNGSCPQGGLLRIDSRLYGVTSGWGNPSVNNGTIFYITVPEPSTLALLGVGALGLLAYGWRRRPAT